MDYSPAGSSAPWNFPGKNTGVGCHSLLQGIFLTQGLNLRLLMSTRFRHKQVGIFFTTSTTWEALEMVYPLYFTVGRGQFYGREIKILGGKF